MENEIVEFIAKVAHQVNKAYCEALGDNTQPEWKDAPQWQRDSAIAGVMFHMENPEVTPEASHELWLSEKVANGWKYGETKDEAKKEHPCIVPYNDLPEFQRAKDYIFRGVVRAIVS